MKSPNREHQQRAAVSGYQIFWTTRDGNSGVFHSWDNMRAREFARERMAQGDSVKIARRSVQQH